MVRDRRSKTARAGNQAGPRRWRGRASEAFDRNASGGRPAPVSV